MGKENWTKYSRLKEAQSSFEEKGFPINGNFWGDEMV